MRSTAPLAGLAPAVMFSKMPVGTLDADSEDVQVLLGCTTSNDDQESPEQPPRSIGFAGESALVTFLQVILPFFLAGIGTVFAGLFLDKVQLWPVFQSVNEIFILVPALLGLKGNLEMTLASRLSTAANTRSLISWQQRFSLIGGNLALVQLQALILAVLTTVAAMVFSWVYSAGVSWSNGILLLSSSLCAASIASAVLSALVSLMVTLAGSFGVNPDNIATPIAGSLGDLITLIFLAYSSSWLLGTLEHSLWISISLTVFFLLLIPMFSIVVYRNTHVKFLVLHGWIPVIAGMAISSGGGLILSKVVSKFTDLAVVSPVVNGIGGNLVAIQASRITTRLHQTCHLGSVPDGTSFGICGTFFRGDHGKSALVLMALSAPGHVLFLVIISKISSKANFLTGTFILPYLTVSCIQVFLLLFLCNWLVHFLWNRRCDPDNHAIPYLTAVGDLLGTLLLAVHFLIQSRVS